MPSLLLFLWFISIHYVCREPLLATQLLHNRSIVSIHMSGCIASIYKFSAWRTVYSHLYISTGCVKELPASIVTFVNGSISVVAYYPQTMLLHSTLILIMPIRPYIEGLLPYITDGAMQTFFSQGEAVMVGVRQADKKAANCYLCKAHVAYWLSRARQNKHDCIGLCNPSLLPCQ